MVITQTLIDLSGVSQSHPAKYTDVLLPTMAKMLKGRTRILDPFGGTGKVFLLNGWLPNAQIEAVELEQGFIKHPKTTLGNALYLPWPDDYFDAICTSPTYGNRMGDTLLDSGDYKRMTYTARLGKKLHPDNSGALQWGPKYRDFHERAWTEARRVLVQDGSLVLNIKDHIRGGKQMHVTDWHIECLESLGFWVMRHSHIETPGMTRGQNGDARVPYESVIHFTLERKP